MGLPTLLAILGALRNVHRSGTDAGALEPFEDLDTPSARTRLLGGVTVPESVEGSCDEAASYAIACAEQHQELKARLELAQSRRRGMVFRFGGRTSAWGLGHALPAALLLHDICRNAERVCHIEMYDMDLGKLFGYATGASWDVPETTFNLERLYGPRELHRTIVLDRGIAEAGVADSLSDDARQDEAPLLLVESQALIPFTSDRFLPALPWDAGKDADVRPGLHRCANRFVTEPRFNVTGGGHVVYHLRTGFADVTGIGEDAMPAHDVNSTRHWLAAACPAVPSSVDLHRTVSALEGSAPSVEVLSDAPGLIRMIRAGGVPPSGSDPIVTRSWNVSFAAKLAAARDIVLASRSVEAYAETHSSFLRPAVARSLCSQRAFALDAPHSLCQAFEVCVPQNKAPVSHLPAISQRCPNPFARSQLLK